MNRRSGCDPTNDAVKLLKLAAKLGAHVVGVAFHVGTASTEPSLYATSIAHARRLFDEGKALGHDMHILDIGGGYPGFPSDGPLFSEVCGSFREVHTCNNFKYIASERIKFRKHLPKAGGLCWKSKGHFVEKIQNGEKLLKQKRRIFSKTFYISKRIAFFAFCFVRTDRAAFE